MTAVTVRTNGQTLLVNASVSYWTSAALALVASTSDDVESTTWTTITADTTLYFANTATAATVTVKQLDGTTIGTYPLNVQLGVGPYTLDPVPDKWQAGSDLALNAAGSFGSNVQTGHYYYLFSQGGKNATAWVDGALRISPVEIVRPITIDRLAVDCTTGAASSNVKIVVYGSNQYGDTPVTNLYASGAISSASSGILEASSVALALKPGVYWFGAVAYGGTPTLSTSQVTGHPLVPIDIGTSAPTTGDAGSISQQTTGITTGTIPTTWAGSRASAAPPRIIAKVG